MYTTKYEEIQTKNIIWPPWNIAPGIIMSKISKRLGLLKRTAVVMSQVIVNEQGCHALLVCASVLEDSGEIGCIARNRSGETSFTVQLGIHQIGSRHLIRKAMGNLGFKFINCLNYYK